jgi:glucose-6-phosphate isomerase
MSDLIHTPSFLALQHHARQAGNWSLRDLFAQDPARFGKMSLSAAGLFLDYSKNLISPETLILLRTLAQERNWAARRDAMFSGEKINQTEGRAVLHTALRAPRGTRLVHDGQDVMPAIHQVLARMGQFCERVRSGQWQGYSGLPITDVVNIGIGGSDLGPKMATLALRSYAHERLRLHFVSNVDGHDLDAVLQQVNPATTLFIVASKTFVTQETMQNAQSARQWLLQHAPEDELKRHFVAVSTNLDAIKTFGIDPDNMFPFWDWVGGRYSIWSAIGLPLMLAIGPEGFQAFLAGAHAMDQHFQSAAPEQNMPLLLALIGFWNRSLLGFGSLSIAAYHQDLSRFPAYLQQLEMESNGKRVTRDGQPVGVATCPVIWGDCGTNGQHAYFQLLHQGSDIIPIDFIANLQAQHDLPGHQATLLANCFAQSEAFMRGKNADEVRADLQAQGLPESEITRLLPHKTFPGNRPSNTILMDQLTPATLGALIALYEHKTMVQGVLWDVNSFDQWGVELGKVLAKQIGRELQEQAEPALHDGSTNGLIALARAGQID